MDEKKTDISKRANMHISPRILKGLLGLPESAEIVEVRISPQYPCQFEMVIISPDFLAIRRGHEVPTIWPVFRTDKHGATKLEDWGFPKSEEEDD